MSRVGHSVIDLLGDLEKISGHSRNIAISRYTKRRVYKNYSGTSETDDFRFESVNYTP